MPRRRAKKTAKPLPKGTEKEVEDSQPEEVQFAKELCDFSTREVERRIAAIQAIRDQEIENLLTQLRLLRSCLSKEHLDTPALEFFRENLPNLSVIRNEEDLEFELEWKVKESQSHIDSDERFMHMYPGLSSSLQQMSGFGFSTKSVKTNFLQAAGLHISDLVLDGVSETQTIGLTDTFQTPGVTSQRLSVGITPKTRRLPKNGEMLLSVHGSPLGVYKEDNMDTIEESGET